MRLSMTWYEDDSVRGKVYLSIILVVAFFLRFYHLDVPSMWGDELFAPIITRKPFSYILRWIFVEDVHPPLFYFFEAVNLMFGTSDFALRVFQAAFGTVNVWLCYRLGRVWLGREAGLIVASIMCGFSSQIYISRVVRFYSFTQFVFITSLIFLYRFVQDNDKKSLSWVVALSSLLLMCEYTSIVPVFAVMSCVLYLVMTRADRKSRLKYLFKIGVYCFALPVAFLIATAVQRVGFSGRNQFWWPSFLVFRAIWLGQLGNAQRTVDFPGMALVFVYFAAYLRGAIWLINGERRLFVLSMVFLASPVVVLSIIRPGYVLAFWHIYYLYPVFAILAASCVVAHVASVKGRAGVALVVSLVSLFGYMFPGYNLFYDQYSYGGDLKQVGRFVASDLDPGSVSMFDINSVDMINWYAEQYGEGSRLVRQEVLPERDGVILNVFTVNGVLGYLISNSHPSSAWAKTLQKRTFNETTWSKVAIPSAPVLNLSFDSEPLQLSAHPADFYRHVYAASNVMIDPFWQIYICPTVNDYWSVVRYRFCVKNVTDRALIGLVVAYHNFGLSNIIKVDYSFDQEDREPLFSDEFVKGSKGKSGPVDYDVEKKFNVRRDKPFKTLDLYIYLFCSATTPSYPTSNLNTLGLRMVSVVARPISYDLMDTNTIDPDYVLFGFRQPESDVENKWRWAVGPSQTIAFKGKSNRRMKLSYSFVNPFSGQAFKLVINGKVVGGGEGLGRDVWMKSFNSQEIEFDGIEGENKIEFSFKKINHVNDSFSETDSSPYVAAFTRLRLEPVGAQ